MITPRIVVALLVLGRIALPARAAEPNLLPDPSIEEVQPKDQFGIPFARWSGWVFEGTPEFRNGRLARNGKTAAELVGGPGAKLRLYTPSVRLEPGRYRFTCYLRGLDIGSHAWGLSEDVNFADEQYSPLQLTGTFGWTKLEIVKDVATAQDVVARLGLWAPGRLWVDDAELVRVGAEVPLTPGPVLGQEEAPVAPPAALIAERAVRCPDCGYRSLPEWDTCYACGAPLVASAKAAQGPPVKALASFEDGTVKPFTPAATAAVQEHATDGTWALRLDSSYVCWDGPQDWTGYDFFKADVFSGAAAPTQLYVEIRDQGTTGYWTRVNYVTVVPPGASTVIVPTDLYVGEKSRPGRPLDKARITRFVFSIEGAPAPLWFDNLRLERDLSDSVQVPGLQAYSFGPGTAPPWRGFTAVTPDTLYSAGRGYGFKGARIWRAFDARQPDPLYQTFICIEAGSFVTDLPDGTYHVFINLDNPSGFWGEVQVYRQRRLKANGVEVVNDTMDLPRFLQKYYRFAEVEDGPAENTFDKYQTQVCSEKEFDVEVRGGQLDLEFDGQNWAHSVSALVVYPVAQAERGRQYLQNLRERRRFAFDTYFKRILPDPHRDGNEVVPDLAPTPAEQASGYVVFARDWMADVAQNAIPRRREVCTELTAFASAGELEPLVFSVYPLREMGPVSIAVSDLRSAAGDTVPAAAIEVGVVSHRLSRVTMEGTVYTIAPRFIMPRHTAPINAGVTTTFWLTLHTPATVAAGTYAGTVTLQFQGDAKQALPLTVRLFATPLDPVDIPVGPWGCSISLPWYGEDLGDYDQVMLRKCLAKLREYGCTSFSGMPSLRIRGWQDGRPDLDFGAADAEMATAKAAGFSQVVVNYNGGILGFNNYRIDEAAMKAAGSADYVAFLRAVLTTVDTHARSAAWLPVAYNLCDEPIGDDIPPTAANAAAWRAAAPPTLLTTGATSLESPAPDDPHLPLVRALRIANLNGHDEAAIQAIRAAGNRWAFYNGGNRWTFGVYMYKCAQEYGLAFRLSWHWNCSAGDPYYALDCREDDYSWCATNARQDLIPTLHFERDVREGLDDYRYLLTLARYLREKPQHPAAPAAQALLADKLSAFKLGERNHDAKWPRAEYCSYRLALAEAIAALSR